MDKNPQTIEWPEWPALLILGTSDLNQNEKSAKVWRDLEWSGVHVI